MIGIPALISKVKGYGRRMAEMPEGYQLQRQNTKGR